MRAVNCRFQVHPPAREVICVVLAAGKALPRPAVPGPITVQCLEGEVEFELPDRVTMLRPGTLLCVEGTTPHSLKALSNASLLLTIVLLARPVDAVQRDAAAAKSAVKRTGPGP